MDETTNSPEESPVTNAAESPTPDIEEDKSPPQPAPPPLQARKLDVRSFLEHTKLYLGILGSVVALFSASWAFFPSLTIQPTVIQTDKKPSSVDFTVTNTGRLTVYDLLFSCNIKSPNGSRIETKGNFVYSQDGVMAQRVNFLAPGNSATRSCDVGAQIPDIGYPATFDFTVDFVWPFIRKPSSVTKHFTTRRGAPGNIMIVPD